MKTKFLSPIAACSLLLVLSACGTKTDNAPPASTDNQAAADNKAAADKADKDVAAQQDATEAVDHDAVQDTTDEAPAPREMAPNMAPQAPVAQPSSESVSCDNAEGCECGDVTCPMNGVCTDGVCKCGDTLIDSSLTGYSCWEISKDRYDIGCTQSDGCPCGKITVYSNMGCSGKWGTCAGSPVTGRGLACRHKPYKNMYYSLVCFKDECNCYGKTITKDEVCEPLECTNGYSPTPQGCTCDGREYNEKYICVPSKENKMVNYCIDPNGCECGENTCPMGAVCRRDKCVDRTTLKDLPEGFEIVKGIPKCTAEECLCHKAKCKTGKYCLNAYCYNDPYFRKIDGNTYYYRILGGDDLADAGENEKYRDQLWDLLFIDEQMPICQRYASIKIKGSDDDLCQNDTTKNMTVAEALTHCGTAPIPENVSNLYCTFGINNGALELSGWTE